MSDLIDRLEKATGPDRELDRLIQWHDLGEVSHGPVPVFTTSIDAALTLLPESWQAILYTENKTAELYDASLELRAGIKARAQGATMAIAICIAALKARRA